MQQVLQRPNIHRYLPHLRQHLNSLSPNVVLGQGRHGGERINTSTNKHVLICKDCIKTLMQAFPFN